MALGRFVSKVFFGWWAGTGGGGGACIPALFASSRVGVVVRLGRAAVTKHRATCNYASSDTGFQATSLELRALFPLNAQCVLCGRSFQDPLAF